MATQLCLYYGSCQRPPAQTLPVLHNSPHFLDSTVPLASLPPWGVAAWHYQYGQCVIAHCAPQEWKGGGL